MCEDGVCVCIHVAEATTAAEKRVDVAAAAANGRWARHAVENSDPAVDGGDKNAQLRGAVALSLADARITSSHSDERPKKRSKTKMS